MTSLTERTTIIDLINQAILQGARQAKACATIDLSERTLQRWQKAVVIDVVNATAYAVVVDVLNDALNDVGNSVDPAPAAPTPAPAPAPIIAHADRRSTRIQTPKNKLAQAERDEILRIANTDEFAHLPPSQIVPKLADQGIYIASEATFYRVLRAAQQIKHRGKERAPHERKKPRALSATAPNQLFSWDITYLPTTIKGVYFYLYLFMDIFSRKVVGWQIYATESSEQASEVMRDICARENIAPNQVTLHSDNGSSMKGATMLATLKSLGVMPSFSRPAVSNDNPYSESLFKTMKYHTMYPKDPFEDLLAARMWAGRFANWYNNEHQHSAISYVTPGQRHDGTDCALLDQRIKLYQAARARNPLRWSGQIRSWKWVSEVYLNPNQDLKKNDDKTKGDTTQEKAA